MKISELIERLKEMQNQIGDVTVLVPVETQDEQPLQPVSEVVRFNAGKSNQPRLCAFIS